MIAAMSRILSDPSALDLVNTGVVGSALVGLYFITKIIVEWWKQRNEEEELDSVQASRYTGDLVAVNSALKGNLKDERIRNNELGEEVADLRRQNLELWKQLRAQRESYEAQIAELQAQAADFTRQLQELQLQIRRGYS